MHVFCSAETVTKHFIILSSSAQPLLLPPSKCQAHSYLKEVLVDTWSLFHWSQYSKLFHQGRFFCLALPASWCPRGAHHPPVTHSTEAHKSYCSAGALPMSVGYPGDLQNHKGWKRPLRSWSPTVNPTPPCLLNHALKTQLPIQEQENLCNVRMRRRGPSLFLKTENHRQSQVSDTCLNLDGTSPNCSDSLAHKVNIHLGSVFLEFCQDLQRKHTSVSPWGHRETISHSDKWWYLCTEEGSCL